MPKSVYGPEVTRIRQLCDNVNKNIVFVVLDNLYQEKDQKDGCSAAYNYVSLIIISTAACLLALAWPWLG